MLVYRNPVDIANRALQHIGQTRISDVLGFNEDSKAAAECGFSYDKLRQAELRRGLWKFSIRKVALRALDANTKFLSPTLWSSTTTYSQGAVVTDDTNTIWVSTAGSNLAQAPGNSSFWETYCGPLSVSLYDATIQYSAGELVYIAAQVYMSTQSGNAQTPPGSQWIAITATIAAINILYPIGTGPSEQTTTRNVYRLPANFLRKIPQDPKAGSTSVLGGPSGVPYTDWLIEGDYIVSMEAAPIIFRFGADVTWVPSFDPMFCEGLAARIALELCEPLTQSSTKKAAIASEYQKFMSEARIVNAIENEAIESAEDDYVTVRG